MEQPTVAPSLEDLTTLEETADLHQGEFLAGFYVTDAPLFEEWMLTEREHLRRELEETLEQLMRGYSHLGQLQPAIAFAHRWLALDPLREAAHRALDGTLCLVRRSRRCPKSVPDLRPGS